ncbi:hypothetical protein ACLOJK_022444 [Asimina triloba]
MKKRQQAPRKGEHPLRSTGSSSNARSGGARYGECQKNHAANIGGFAVDGCREFMASGEEGTSAEFKCAACGCHRNFHRRDFDSDDSWECTSPYKTGK